MILSSFLINFGVLFCSFSKSQQSFKTIVFCVVFEGFRMQKTSKIPSKIRPRKPTPPKLPKSWFFDDSGCYFGSQIHTKWNQKGSGFKHLQKGPKQCLKGGAMLSGPKKNQRAGATYRAFSYLLLSCLVVTWHRLHALRHKASAD